MPPQQTSLTSFFSHLSPLPTGSSAHSRTLAGIAPILGRSRLADILNGEGSSTHSMAYDTSHVPATISSPASDFMGNAHVRGLSEQDNNGNWGREVTQKGRKKQGHKKHGHQEHGNRKGLKIKKGGAATGSGQDNDGRMPGKMKNAKKQIACKNKDMEEDIENTDHEEEEDDERSNEDDRAFLDDVEFSDDGLQQVRCEQENMQDNERSDMEEFHEAINMVRRPVGRPKGSVGKRKRNISGDNENVGEDEDSKKDKKRQNRRQLEVSCERGVGDTSRSVSDYHARAPFFLKCADLVTPWDKQPGRVKVDFGMERGKLGMGAFGSEQHRRWVNDDQAQMEFAKRFYVPMNERIPLRTVGSDVDGTPVNPTRCRTNSTSKVLHAFRLMHAQTELDLMHGRYYEKVLLGLQRTSRELRQNIDSGPFGGLQGKPVDVLWRVYAGEEVTNVSEDTLCLVQAIAMALQGSKGDELWPMVCTPLQDPYVRGKSGMSKVQSGVQTLRQYNFHEACMHAGRGAVDDIDERLVKKVWKYRYAAQEMPWTERSRLSMLLHSRFRNAQPELSGTEIRMEAQQPTIDPVIVDIWLYKDIFAAWDEKTQQRTNVTVEAIYVLAKSAACDPLVIMKSIAENNPTASTLMSNVFQHMLHVVGLESCSWDQLFNTDRAGATDVVSESRMLEGVFKYCNTHSLRNLNIGGFRMDVCNELEMSLWERNMRAITMSRRTHYEIMTRETLHDRNCGKDSKLPLGNWALDLVHGQIYWKVTVAKVQQEIAEYTEQFHNEEERTQVAIDLQEWLVGGRFFVDQDKSEQVDTGTSLYPKYMFLQEGVGFAMNSGIWIKVRTDNHQSYEDEKYELKNKGARQKSKNDEAVSKFPQPQQQNSMIRLWFNNTLEANDPLDEIFCQSELVPDLHWMTEQMPTLERVGESMQLFKEAVGDVVSISASRHDLATNSRMNEILMLAGKHRNPLRDRLSNLEDNTSLKYVFRMKMNKINTTIKQTLQIMRASELVQWRIAAMGVVDLSRQSKAVKDKWVSDYKPMQLSMQNVQEEAWQDLLCAGTRTSIFYTCASGRIDSDLSFMNTMLQRLLTFCFMAHNMNTPGAYGMTLRVGDMACSVNVLRETEGKGGSVKSTSVWLYDPKHPGMGIDQCTGNLGQQCNAAMIHMSLTKEHRELASMSVDTSLKNVSKMSYATLQGSGVLVNSSGDMVAGNTQFAKQCGKCCYFTEYGKQADDNIMMGWMESLMANSGDQELGGESGVQQGSWQTTQNCDNLTILPIKKMPILIITGNRPAPATPASAVEGARWINIASSTQDKNNGFFVVAEQDVTRIFTAGIPRNRVRENTTEDEEGNAKVMWESVTAQAGLANSISRGDVRKDIKVIKREVVLRNRMHFLLMQWIKTDAVLLLSALTSDPKSYTYTLMTNFSNIECAVAQLTGGLRREYLNKDARFWHRNAAGPWDKVMQVSMHVYMAMSTSLLSTMQRTTTNWPLDLFGAYTNGIKAVMTHTIPFLAMISSLHIWLAGAVLDINVMILCCYVYHFTGFQTPCSLRVLSLAIVGKLKKPTAGENDEDWTSYVAFCKFLEPCVMEASILSRTQTNIGPRNVRQGLLSIPSFDTLGTWASWFVPACHKDIETSYAARTQGAEQERLSVYCKPRMSFVSTDSIKGFGRSKEGHPSNPDENISGTSARVLATMLAREQKPFAHMKRLHAKQPLASHEDTSSFWETVQTGTALPRASTSTNDVFKINFEYVPYTGIWWDETMKNAGSCEGLLKLFLLQSGLDPHISHYEFFHRIMAAYLADSGSDDHVYGGRLSKGIHKHAWHTPVLEKLQVFEFTSKPKMDQQGVAIGVEVNIAMRLTHYVLMQGLGITKDWDKKMHENSSFVSCIHLRNMSSLSLGCLGLLLHTCCDKVLIPSNNGVLRLPAPSPVFESKDEAQVQYDSRLHIDTHQHTMGGQSDNVLCVAARLATNNNWQILDFSSGETALWYSPVLCDDVKMTQAQSRANLFPFPPEAVAHTAFFFEDMTLANRRFLELQQKQDEKELEGGMDVDKTDGVLTINRHNNFALAMLALGESISFEDFQHMQPSLTDCAIRDAREIPCVTLQHGFLFVLVFRDGSMFVRPVLRTHEWKLSQEDREIIPFLPLPLQQEDEEACLSSSDFFEFFHHGIGYQNDHGVSIARIDLSCSQDKMPFYIFPVVHFPILLLLEHSGWWNAEDLLLMHTQNYFYAQQHATFWFRECDDEWCLKNCPDAVRLFEDCKAVMFDLRLQVIFVDNVSTEIMGFWAKNQRSLAYFMSEKHVRQELRHNKFMDDTLYMFADAGQSDSHNGDLIPDHGEPDKAIQKENQSRSYLMIKSRHGYVPVHRAEHLGKGMLIADFSCAGHTDQVFTFTELFDKFQARMLPSGEELDYECTHIYSRWGLVVENKMGSFLEDGVYTVSTMTSRPLSVQMETVSVQIDYINMSRCMLIEGSEVWVNVTSAVYAMIIQQAKEQGFCIMLPITKCLHENMIGCRFLRGFYVLGGSLHTEPIHRNLVRIIFIIAKQTKGEKISLDDHAGLDSAVNKHSEQKNTRMVAVSLPMLDDTGACLITCDRDEKMPFYIYLSERSLTRN